MQSVKLPKSWPVHLETTMITDTSTRPVPIADLIQLIESWLGALHDRVCLERQGVPLSYGLREDVDTAQAYRPFKYRPTALHVKLAVDALVRTQSETASVPLGCLSGLEFPTSAGVIESCGGDRRQLEGGYIRSFASTVMPRPRTSRVPRERIRKAKSMQQSREDVDPSMIRVFMSFSSDCDQESHADH